MRMIDNYEEFCKLSFEGKVFPDISSDLGFQSVQYLRKQGWKIRGGIFSKSKTRNDLLALCRQSPENFEQAYKNAGIDFWTKDD
ncbi:MAG: hypothetical protein AAF969_15665 [Bacteroidota bacterium]